MTVSSRCSAGGAFADLHPSPAAVSWFRAASYFGTRKIDLHATPVMTGTVKIGDVTYTGSQVGQLDGRVKMSKLAPSLASAATTASPATAAGAACRRRLQQKKPDVTLVASGPAGLEPPVPGGAGARALINIREDAKGFRVISRSSRWGCPTASIRSGPRRPGKGGVAERPGSGRGDALRPIDAVGRIVLPDRAARGKRSSSSRPEPASVVSLSR